MPLIDSTNVLRYVTNLHPLTIVTPDLRTGECKTTFLSASDMDQSMAHIRGGPAFIRVGSMFVTVGHKRVDYPLGPIYTHYLVFISSHPTWEVSYLSQGFRLPSNSSQVDDIQFVVGIMLKVRAA
jgi:hypothetical protein